MRIGLIAPPWVPVPPVGYGGTELVVDLLARGLQDRGHEVLLAASSDSTCPVPLAEGTAGSDFEILNDVTSLLTHLITAYAAMRDVDIIHDHTIGGSLYRGRPAGVPVVITNHGPFLPENQLLFKTVGAEAAVVAISHNQASHAVDCPIAKVIHHGLDMSTVPVGVGGGGYAAFLGRMSPTKGIVEAVRIAREAEVPLRIAAKMREPAERNYFESQVKPLLSGEHQYVGEISDADKYAFLGDAFALLNPIQWSEPFGLVMIEALGTGTPVVGTARGSAPEIVRPGITGFLGKTGDLPALLRRAGEIDRATCRADVEQRFSAERMVEDHISLYTELLAGRVSASGIADQVPI